MRAPLVSVVIPANNAERWIDEAITSALKQSHDAIECVVVDDGSTDGTADVVASFGRDVRLIRTERRGVAAARNAGLDQASGELVAFLDADDVWLPEKIERQVDVLTGPGQAGVGLVLTGYLIFDDAGGTARRRVRAVVRPRLSGTAISRWLSLEGNAPLFSSTALMPRRIAMELGPFDARLSTSADLLMAWRVLARYRVLAVRDVLACYRAHHEQMSRHLGALEHDMRLILTTALGGDELPAGYRRRCEANLEAHLGARHLLAGHTRMGAAHLGRALAIQPRQVVLLPLAALARRVERVAAARAPGPAWP